MTRMLSATAFAGAALAFALPFGVASSCDGEEVHFTGSQLATFTVPPDPERSGVLHEDLERNAGLLAAIALLASCLGLGVAVLNRAGGGICASVGLLGMQLLAWGIGLTADGGSSLLSGFWIALGSLAAAGLLHLILALRRRRLAGRRRWPYALGRCVLVLAPTLALAALVVGAVAE
jgi:hypothetical protein